jgi:ribonuclease BN (tRNA processing enzyme)
MPDRTYKLIAMARAMMGGFGLHFVEVSEQAQAAGPVSFRAVRVEHDPALACYGYLLELAGRTIGYSGDTRLCAGLRELARRADLLVVECNHRHAGPESIAHLSLDDVRTLRAEYPQLPLVLTHRGAAVDAGGMADVWVPQDLETLQL